MLSGSQSDKRDRYQKRALGMKYKRVIYDHASYAHFITFSCYKRRRLLDDDVCKRIVVSSMASQLKKRNGECLGFVIMPDHVHSLIKFSEDGVLSSFMQQWKRTSSYRIKQIYNEILTGYIAAWSPVDPIWQRHYYSFNVFEESKLHEKLEYMQNNPVKAGLAASPTDWAYSSAKFYENGRQVGVSIDF